MENTNHSITIDNREKFNASGIIDILSFDEETIVAQTNNGILIIRGSNLHISSLNLDKGILTADGNISGINYDNESTSKCGLLGRLFRWYYHLHINASYLC